MSSIITGRVWKFGDNINTDLMLPNIVNGGASTLDEQGSAVFSANRPGWVDEMRPGDFIVGGKSYGIGSNRPAARSLRHIGVACLLAETINGLFKAEVIHRRGPWRNAEAVEFATLEWVAWFNNRRLLEPIGNIPPAEAEARYYAQANERATAA